MTAQVMYLFTGYYPTTEEAERLNVLQETLTNAHAELAYSCRGFSLYQKYITKQSYHIGFRSRWRVYKGFKGAYLFKLISMN